MKQLWSFDKASEEFLIDLLEACAPSMEEDNVQRLVTAKLKQFGATVKQDGLGNVMGIINANATCRILLTAHADEIGMQVKQITTEGMLKIRKVGGIDIHSMYGQRVKVLTSDGIALNGVIGRDPQHINESEAGYTIRTSEMWVDVGASNKEELTDKITPGDMVVFAPGVMELMNRCITSKSLDNRVGVFCVLKATELLIEAGTTIGIALSTTVQEEIGLRGAQAVVNRLQPDAAFVVDVEYAGDIPGKEGNERLGKGVILTRNADNNPVLRQLAGQVCLKKGISHQFTIGSNLTGCTDAEAMQRASNGVATLNVSIPNRYMHSHAEICSLYDLEAAINMMVQTILEIDKKKLDDFAPFP